MEPLPEHILKERDMLANEYKIKFFQKPEFPYLHSMAVDDALHAFNHKTHGFIGAMHLHYVPDPKGEEYGEWKEEWIGSPQMLEETAKAIFHKHSKIYHPEKLLEAFAKYAMQRKMDVEVEMVKQQQQDKEYVN